MSQVLALKFSSANPEQLLGILSTEEVLEVIRARVRQELEPEIRDEYESRVSDAEDEASDAEGRADGWECDATGLYRGIEKALTQNWEEAKLTLQRTMQDYGQDID
ncbi:Uncharacterised protein [Serratia quinivorans]|uniref:hypothetical protein n=1 Tax=Serratia quinivorans TaxID=137545 RepID=UPI00217BB04A|nr:hypothetical protein [Serratia quinivorans]CAI1622020.1 Uncharacterised protein [Serratia quinivorans]CAI2395329.1 Uncharacterised protein [Serratia quinivorans]